MEMTLFIHGLALLAILNGSSASTSAIPSPDATEMMSSSVTIETTPVINTAGTPPPGTQYGCPQKHFDLAAAEIGVLFTVEDTCFEMIPTFHSWAIAEADCKQRGGHLATIDTEEKQTLIYQIITSFDGPTVWIGLHDRDSEEQFKWVSGDPVTYTNWFPHRKSLSLHNIEDCVVLVTRPGYNGTWDDSVCTAQHGYICEFDAVSGSEIGTTMTPNTTDNGDGDSHMCPLHLLVLAQQYGTDVAQHGNSCYELLKSRATYPHAEQLCQEAGGHLASINNAEEQAYIQNFMMRHNQTRPVWIGLNDHNTEGTFEWTNGEPLTYTNWLDGHEDNSAGHNEEDCVALVPNKNGTWDDIRCGFQGILGNDAGEVHAGFCEYDTVPKIPGAMIVG
ncbi:macrophage mannose receptor 1-like [Dreissena polymorpha]|uniref:C-type lectin domain-containing protein n=1 Tax=Dreissena polymorpha TaxID=45954 RepID=A0A9D3XXK8_DREPO|nr:macrophage mannose receptor 1-like [Dreissena polymorpha]KAH3690244.1 hypothetical protein DPMN_192412 [Dreissena polymorpha]